MTWIKVAQASELKRLQKICVKINSTSILLIWDSSQIYAIENKCSHASKPLDEGTINNKTISCPFHGASFCLTTGDHLSPPAFKGIKTFSVRRNNDVIEINH